MSKILIPHGLTRAQLDAFRSVEMELNRLANGGTLTTGTGVPALTSNLQDGSLYYDYTNLNLYVFSGSTTSNAVAVVANGITSQWQTTAATAETTATSASTSAATAQATANTAQVTATTAISDANTAQITANTANTAANTAQGTANTAVTNANTAQIAANTAQTTANTAVSDANTAQITANTGVANANTAQITANTGVANANTAQIAANTAQTTANTGVTNANTAQIAANAAATTANTASTAATAATANAAAAQANANAIQISLFGSGNPVSSNTIAAGTGALTGGRSFYVVGANVQADLFNANSIVTSGPLAGTGSNSVGVYGQATGASTGHGVRGRNTTNNRSGLVGPANAYDFYAENAGTYGPFTGSHDALTLLDHNGVEGDILIDTLCVCRGNLSNTIFEATTSTTANQKAAIGIHAGLQGLLSDQYEPAAFVISRDDEEVATFRPEWDAAKSIYNLISVNSVGEGQMNIIGEGGNLAAGDLIVTSSTPGKGMKQSDDIVRAYTVAKVREAVTFNSLTEEKLVACIYLCG